MSTNAATQRTDGQTEFVIPPPPLATLKVRGTDALYPVRRVYCVGRNYAAHLQRCKRRRWNDKALTDR